MLPTLGKRDLFPSSSRVRTDFPCALLLTAITLLLPGCLMLSIGGQSNYGDSAPSPFVQQGHTPFDHGVEQDVYYPFPYASPPNLTIHVTDNWSKYEILDQKPDHFRIRVDHVPPSFMWTGEAPAVEWEAKGVLRVPAKETQANVGNEVD